MFTWFLLGLYVASTRPGDTWRWCIWCVFGFDLVCTWFLLGCYSVCVWCLLVFYLAFTDFAFDVDNICFTWFLHILGPLALVCTWFLIGELGVYLVVTWFYLFLHGVSVKSITLFCLLRFWHRESIFVVFYVVVDLVLVFTWLLHGFYMIFTLCVFALSYVMIFCSACNWFLPGCYMVFTWCLLFVRSTCCTRCHCIWLFTWLFLGLTLFLAVVFLA